MAACQCCITKRVFISFFDYWFMCLRDKVLRTQGTSGQTQMGSLISLSFVTTSCCPWVGCCSRFKSSFISQVSFILSPLRICMYSFCVACYEYNPPQPYSCLTFELGEDPQSGRSLKPGNLNIVAWRRVSRGDSCLGERANHRQPSCHAVGTNHENKFCRGIVNADQPFTSRGQKPDGFGARIDQSTRQ